MSFRLKCAGCGINKAIEGNFSNKQKAAIRAEILSKGQHRADFSMIRCIHCTGIQRIEATCTDCDQTLGREAFNKLQLKRENPVSSSLNQVAYFIDTHSLLEMPRLSAQAD